MSLGNVSLNKRKNTKVDQLLGEIPVVLYDSIIEDAFLSDDDGSSNSEVFGMPASGQIRWNNNFSFRFTKGYLGSTDPV